MRCVCKQPGLLASGSQRGTLPLSLHAVMWDLCPIWRAYLCLAAQGLSEETNIALNATIRALDLDVRQSVQGLPMEELVTAGLLSKFLLCSKQGIIQACHARPSYRTHHRDYPTETFLDLFNCSPKFPPDAGVYEASPLTTSLCFAG